MHGLGSDDSRVTAVKSFSIIIPVRLQGMRFPKAYTGAAPEALYGIDPPEFGLRSEIIFTQSTLRICFCDRPGRRHRSSNFRLHGSRRFNSSPSAAPASRATRRG